MVFNFFEIVSSFLYDCPLLTFGKKFKKESLFDIKHYFKRENKRFIHALER